MTTAVDPHFRSIASLVIEKKTLTKLNLLMKTRNELKPIVHHLRSADEAEIQTKVKSSAGFSRQLLFNTAQL
jgi:hypothetical protein